MTKIYLIMYGSQPFFSKLDAVTIGHLGKECRDSGTSDGVGDINKDLLIIQILHPYTLDTSNPCWYDVDIYI